MLPQANYTYFEHHLICGYRTLTNHSASRRLLKWSVALIKRLHAIHPTPYFSMPWACSFPMRFTRVCCTTSRAVRRRACGIEDRFD
jgi:hypothetical protein